MPVKSTMRTFYIVWAGQLVSTLGTGLTAFSIGVWLFQQTGTVTPLAFLLLFRTLPVIVLSPLAGALVDRWKRRQIILLSDAGAALSTLVLVLLFIFTDVPLWGLYTLVAFASACEAFQRPALLASITQLVPKEQFGRAAGITQIGQGASEIIAPLIAGLLLATVDISGILLIDVGTFLVAVTTLLVVRFPAHAKAPQDKQDRVLLRDIIEAAHTIRQQPGLTTLLLLFMIVGFQSGIIGSLIQPLILSFTTPQILGLIFTLAGTGYLSGSLLLSAWGGPQNRINGVLVATLGFGVFLTLIGLRPLAWLVAIAATLAHFFIPFVNGLNQAIWQNAVPEHIQGRVFALKEMATRTALMLAYIVAGPLADNGFGPMLMPDGALADTVGPIIGVGLGRGMGFIFSISGVLVVVTALMGFANSRLKQIDNLPATDSSPHTKPHTAQS